MSDQLTFAAIPRSLDGDEVPFVIAFSADPRPELVLDGVAYRRGDDRFILEHIVDEELRVRALCLDVEGACMAIASAGGILVEWWPLLAASPPDPARPVLSAAVRGEKLTMRSGDLEVPVTLTSSPELGVSYAAFGLGEGFTDENVQVSAPLSLPVIKVALLAFAEYATLVDEIPDMDIEQNGLRAPLAGVLESAGAFAELIDWHLATDG